MERNGRESIYRDRNAVQTNPATSLIAAQKVTLADGSLEDRGALCRAIVADAERGAVEIFTSALALAEVCKLPSDPSDANERIRDFFENDFIVIVRLDRRTGEIARSLMQSGYAGLKPPDAVHLASAAVSMTEEFHTFDGRLLGLSGKISKTDGTKLKICKPSMGGPALPLLDAPWDEEAEETEERDAAETATDGRQSDATAPTAGLPKVQNNDASQSQELTTDVVMQHFALDAEAAYQEVVVLSGVEAGTAVQPPTAPKEHDGRESQAAAS